jgi:hypothetical protein
MEQQSKSNAEQGCMEPSADVRRRSSLISRFTASPSRLPAATGAFPCIFLLISRPRAAAARDNLL